MVFGIDLFIYMILKLDILGCLTCHLIVIQRQPTLANFCMPCVCCIKRSKSLGSIMKVWLLHLKCFNYVHFKSFEYTCNNIPILHQVNLTSLSHNFISFGLWRIHACYGNSKTHDLLVLTIFTPCSMDKSIFACLDCVFWFLVHPCE